MDWIARIHSTRLHVVMYALLLLATPAILVQNFLQTAIQQLSESRIELFKVDIFIIPTIAAILCITAVVMFWRNLSKVRLLGVFIAVAMITLTQQFTDFYLDHNFWDLQQNWHYIAYALFSFFIYRDLEPRGISWNNIIKYTYFIALAVSTFDEAFQRQLSNRVFDVSDIAKDVWGVLIGLVLIRFWVSQPFLLSKSKRRLRHTKFSKYFSQPFNLLFLLIMATFFFVFFSSLLTDFAFWKYIIILTFGASAIFLILLHISQYKRVKIFMTVVLILLISAQLGFFLKFRHQGIVYNCYALSVYKGIPLPFFDIMIYPNGMFRLVDKKHSFNQGDRRFMLRQKPDIIVIGSGIYKKGGKGFPKKAISQFIYNRYTHKGTQVIILENKKACNLFNRLKKENKNVLFILHNTC